MLRPTTYTILAAAGLGLLSVTLPASAGVVLELQEISALSSAGTACDTAPNENPDRMSVFSDGFGDVIEDLAVSQASACGDVTASATVRLQARGDEITGSIGAAIALDEVGVAHANSSIELVLLADEETVFRIEASWSHIKTGDEPQLGGAWAAFSTGPSTTEPGGLQVWEGTLEPGVSYEFSATTLIHRNSFELSTGEIIYATGESTGSVSFTISFLPGNLVADQTRSVGQLKSLY